MKKALPLALSFLLLFSASACSNSSEQTTSPDSPLTENTSEALEFSTTDNNSNETTETTSSSENIDNEIKLDYDKEIYTNETITVTYPNVSKMITDKRIAALANNTIKADAIAFIEGLGIDTSSDASISIKDIVITSDNILSIVYEGTYYSDNSAYPTEIRYTSNINLKNGQRARLAEYANINKIADIIANTDNFKCLADNSSLNEEQIKYIQGYTDSRLAELLDDADFSLANKKVVYPEIFSSYDKNNSVTISFTVPHAIGDHAEFTVKLSDIQ